MTFRRAFFAAFATAALFGLAWGCAATGDRDNLARASGGSNGLADASTDADASVEPDGNPRDAGMLGLNPLCHNIKSVTPGCVPDSPDSCRDFKPPAASAGDAGPDAYGQGGTSGEGGAGGDSAGPIAASGASDGGASGSTGEDGASAAAGESSVAGAAGATNVTPTTPAEYGCQVRRSDDEPNTPYSHCELAGPGGENAPCLTSTDCQAGLGCVGDQTAGLCEPYCCQDADDCKSGTYCTPRPMRDALTNSVPRSEVDQYALQIPVCVHAKNCDLSTPYPCTKAGGCACETGTACMVVRADGTTTCIPPGTGKVGQACPCAWGHICSAASNTCLKLCNTQDSSACGEGKCQSASQLPAGWGVCVGLPSSG
ncbi:MAG TPA: hypothetical protein VER96_40105 [Polyangiaceae bacterium]|nr:hypothetical protein [Polyangiaceae bacterium]